MLLGDGDGFIHCDCGERHWGLHGAAGLLLSTEDRGVLLQHRAGWTHHGETWALPGGAVRSDETPAAAAIRETWEETAVPPEAVALRASLVHEHGSWRYTTVLATLTTNVEPHSANDESLAVDWVEPSEVEDYPLHRDFAASWPALRDQLGRQLVLVVDAANVVGSRPDGWWRDRAGAALRLRDRLSLLGPAGIPAADAGLNGLVGWRWWPRVLLVVEGKASATPAAPGVEVITARADGDTAIVETAEAARNERPRDHVVVVTADRELKERVRAVGAVVAGPSALLTALDALEPAGGA
ncbi:ADP-ribose pyrophosphatase [Prauserella marina]|uniref:ADP-ribose pyrophosphatase YjhB, NUDIX family n=1 Tax=Prauserella marina TaxID=530584 RepID=A0A222VN97_9PSEU|nr:NUDIX domain-containing protein [Prauserella marina]ASR35390.1 ADP-ribose pyrophosphatase [Prauserella marina]PWV84810.1 ADP-ribose pyrophosphatase YjhB (NUDIX family) [Prauserella marina]SDC12566.1 ADP-ribose pyrophosphatase YjhB, NUDIX family [Prauserella marina]